MTDKSYLNLEIKKFNEDEKNYTFEGYAAVFGNKDYGADIVVKGAFIDSLATDHKVKILWQHDKSIPVGVPINIYEDDNGLFVKGILPKDDIFVKERVMPQMRIGSLELSFGYKILEKEFQDDIRIIKKAFVFEISLVSIGMNRKAQIIKYKSLDLDNIKELNPRDMEAAFKNGFQASNNMAKKLVSLIKADSQREVDNFSGRDAQMIQDMKNIKYKRLIDSMSKIKNKIK